jgi:outer membrane protein
MYDSSMRYFTAAALMFASTNLIAQSTDDGSQPRNGWRVTAGAGVAVIPEFPGSDDVEIRPMPAFDVRYGERWFLNGDGLGVWLIEGERWQLSGSIGVDLVHRDESDAPHLRGTGDVDRTALAMLKGGYSIGPVQVILRVSTDIADEQHGTVADLTLQAHSQLSPKLRLSYGLAGRLANDEYMRTFFGVDTMQRARSGLRVYEAKSGISEAQVFVKTQYAIDAHWLVIARGAVAELQGDAVDSPIVEEDRHMLFDAALLYRF